MSEYQNYGYQKDQVLVLHADAIYYNFINKQFKVFNPQYYPSSANFLILDSWPFKVKYEAELGKEIIESFKNRYPALDLPLTVKYTSSEHPGETNLTCICVDKTQIPEMLTYEEAITNLRLAKESLETFKASAKTWENIATRHNNQLTIERAGILTLSKVKPGVIIGATSAMMLISYMNLIMFWFILIMCVLSMKYVGYAYKF